MKQYILLFFALIFSYTTYCQNYSQEGDNCFDAGDYACAELKYEELYKLASESIKQITDIKIQRAKRCSRYLKIANKEFDSHNYLIAKENYQFILDSNPKDDYAKSQIEKCDKAIEDAITLTVPYKEVTLSPYGGDKRISVNTSAESFTVSQLPSWCSVQLGSDYFLISYETNLSDTSRNGVFKVMAGKKEVNGSVTQPPKPKIETTLSVSEEFISIKANGEIIFINVNTNSSDYEITKLPAWCRVNGKYESWFSLECDENKFRSSRTGDLTITAGDKKVTIRLEQVGVQKSETIAKYESPKKTAKYRPSTARYRYFAIGYEGGQIAKYGFRMEFGGRKFIGMFLNVRSTLISDDELIQNYGALENINEAIIGLNFRISRVVYFNLGGGYGYYKIPEINESLQQVEYYPAYSGLTFRLGRRINFSVGASFSDIEQTIDNSDFDPEFTLGLTINLLK